MDERLRRAAREGNVSDLYTLIQEDGNVLKRIDKVEFIDTPLHIAADAGCTRFAMEILSLKPSFSMKLNHEGLSPIHIAVRNGHIELVLLLLENANHLIRLKGKNGETPLHFVVARGKKSDELLTRFLEDCPESVRDVTAENQTALHIAVRDNKVKALKLLCNILSKTDYCQDEVNLKDSNGETALHIAARGNRHEMIKLLLKSKADKHATNQDGYTALDMAGQLRNRESIRILRGCFKPGISTFIYNLKKQIAKYVSKATSAIFKDMDNISSEDRNALLVILALLLTVTFQASLSPPGSVFQGNNPADSNVGRSVLEETEFLIFYIPICSVFFVTFFLTLGLLKPYPRGFASALQVLLAILAICFYESILILAPTDLANNVINKFSILVFVLMIFMCISYRVSKISVSVLGCWLYPENYLHYPLYHLSVGSVVLGFLLFIFLYDRFLQGSILVIGYCLLMHFGDELPLIEPIVLLGSWFFLNLCRFCIKRYNERCNASTV